MGAERGEWRPRLRERPPHWARRSGIGEPMGRARWLREPEPFEDRGGFEPYPGATVLEDLGDGDEAAATLRILARYTVVRVLVLSERGVLAGLKLRTERRIALEHLALLPAHDWERHALERLTVLCRETPAREIVQAALVPAECAAKRGHAMGAFALYRAAYELARDRWWWAEAATATRGLARLARVQAAPVSARLWAWRSRVLDERERELTRERERKQWEQRATRGEEEPV
jgi:hypothetical protein